MLRTVFQSRLACCVLVLSNVVWLLPGCAGDGTIIAELTDAGSQVSADTATDVSLDTALTTEVSAPIAPIWPSDAQLTAAQVTASGLVLSWSPATHLDGVARYRIYRDGAELTSLDGSTNALQLHQLSPWTDYKFRVEAEATSGVASVDGPELSVKTSDDARPEWPAGSSLLASDVNADSAQLVWGKAVDDVAVTAYQVFRDNSPVGTVDGDTTQLVVNLPKPGTGYIFRVESSDAAGNISITGPTVLVNSDDESVPWWPDGSQVMASNVAPNQLTLGWTLAEDDVGVVSYRIYKNAVKLMEVDSSHSAQVIEGLAPWQEYSFRIEALDDAGNLSVDGPETTVKTPDHAAPLWPGGAALQVSNVMPSSLTLGWTAAADDVAVTAYQVFLEHVLVGSTDGETTSLEVADWGVSDSLSFQVQALDAAGNLSTDGPSLTVILSDEQAPVWPAGTQLILSDVGPTSMAVGWTAATDNEAVVAYNLFLDGSLALSVGGDQTSATLSSLDALTEYTVLLKAVDSMGNMSSDNPQIIASTSDHPIPVWPLDSSLAVSNLGETSVTLTWSALPDNFDIASFVIQQDSVDVATHGGTTQTAIVAGLFPAVTYVFQVQAVGVTGKTSLNGPQLTVTTPDLSAPEWPSNAVLEAGELQADSVLLSWTVATDTVGVTGYRLLQDETLVTTTEGDTVQWLVEDLSADTSYTFQVQAGDAAGNWSTMGPTVSVKTLKSTLTNENVYNGLSSQCQSCHSSGALGFFASLNDFESLVVGNPKYVVPGDPAASAFLGLLEGGSSLAPGSGGQMPPKPGVPFAEQAANGGATLTMQQLESWVESMGGAL